MEDTSVKGRNKGPLKIRVKILNHFRPPPPPLCLSASFCNTPHCLDQKKFIKPLKSGKRHYLCLFYCSSLASLIILSDSIFRIKNFLLRRNPHWPPAHSDCSSLSQYFRSHPRFPKYGRFAKTSNPTFSQNWNVLVTSPKTSG